MEIFLLKLQRRSVHNGRINGCEWGPCFLFGCVFSEFFLYISLLLKKNKNKLVWVGAKDGRMVIKLLYKELEPGGCGTLM